MTVSATLLYSPTYFGQHGGNFRRTSSCPRRIRLKDSRAMKFVDFVNRNAIRTNVEADTKEEVIRAMASSLLEAGKVAADQYESIVEAILKREELGSTGIGRGVAVPHTKHASVHELVGAVAVSDEGVDFDSLDGEKVHLL